MAKKKECYMVLSRGQLNRMLKKTPKRNGQAITVVWPVTLYEDSRKKIQANIWA